MKKLYVKKKKLDKLTVFDDPNECKKPRLVIDKYEEDPEYIKLINKENNNDTEYDISHFKFKKIFNKYKIVNNIINNIPYGSLTLADMYGSGWVVPDNVNIIKMTYTDTGGVKYAKVYPKSKITYSWSNNNQAYFYSYYSFADKINNQAYLINYGATGNCAPNKVIIEYSNEINSYNGTIEKDLVPISLIRYSVTSPIKGTYYHSESFTAPYGVKAIKINGTFYKVTPGKTYELQITEIEDKWGDHIISCVFKGKSLTSKTVLVNGSGTNTTFDVYYGPETEYSYDLDKIEENINNNINDIYNKARWTDLFTNIEINTEPIDGMLTLASCEKFTLATSRDGKTWNGKLEYSTDRKTWIEWWGRKISSSEDGFLYLRGTGNTIITGQKTSSEKTNRYLIISPIASNIKVYCIGNIENLLDYQTVLKGEHPVMGNNDCFYYMFYNCTSLARAPELPATTLANYCYQCMFVGCTSLVQIPKLPATKLASSCYYGMFSSCTSLKFSATKTEECPNEYRIPSTDTGTTASYALYHMFYGTSGTFTDDPQINTTYYTNAKVI